MEVERGGVGEDPERQRYWLLRERTPHHREPPTAGSSDGLLVHRSGVPPFAPPGREVH